MFATIHFINLLVMGEVLLGEHLFARFLTHRENYRSRLFISTFVCLAAAFLFPVPALTLTWHAGIASIPFGILMYLSIFSASALGLWFCYQEDYDSILFCALTGYTVHQLASALNDFMGFLIEILQIRSDDLAYVQTNVPVGIFAGLSPVKILIYLGTLAIAMTGCYLLFGERIRKFGEIRIDNRKMLLLSGLILLVDVVLGLLNMLIRSVDGRADYQLLICIYNAVSCIFILWLLFGMLSNKRLELELSFLEQMLEEEKKQYHMAKDTIDIINLKCHDLRHQIRRLRTGSENVNKESLREIENAVRIYDSAVHTGNDALDVILTEKSLLCEKEDILLTCIADGAKIGFLPSGDIYALFGNALDNAIEAVRHLADTGRRSISVNVHSQGQLLSIHVENYYDGELQFRDDLPVTNKEDKAYHGFGMRSMQLIAQKYDGYLAVGAKANVFQLDIVIPIP